MRIRRASKPSRKMAPTNDPAMIQGRAVFTQMKSSEFEIRIGSDSSVLIKNSSEQPS